MKIDRITNSNLWDPNFGVTHVEKTRAEKYVQSSSPLKRTLYKGFRLMQTAARRVSEFFKPTPKTPVSAYGLDRGIYFHVPDSDFSASGFVSGQEPNLPRKPFQQHAYYPDNMTGNKNLPTMRSRNGLIYGSTLWDHPPTRLQMVPDTVAIQLNNSVRTDNNRTVGCEKFTARDTKVFNIFAVESEAESEEETDSDISKM